MCYKLVTQSDGIWDAHISNLLFGRLAVGGCTWVNSSHVLYMSTYVTNALCTWVCAGRVNAGELFFQCHIFGMVVLCPRLLHSWWISMQCGVVTGTGADMLSHCDEKHSEMMWRECSSCPQRDGKLALTFVYSFVLACMWVYMFVHTFFWVHLQLCVPIAWH